MTESIVPPTDLSNASSSIGRHSIKIALIELCLGYNFLPLILAFNSRLYVILLSIAELKMHSKTLIRTYDTRNADNELFESLEKITIINLTVK